MVPVPSVRVGLFPKRPVVVPKDGALVVVVPNPAVLLPNKLCCRSQSHRIRKGPKTYHANLNSASGLQKSSECSEKKTRNSDTQLKEASAWKYTSFPACSGIFVLESLKASS